MQGAALTEADGGDIALRIPDVDREKRKTDGWGRLKFGTGTELMLPGPQARLVLGRAMVAVNKKGASRDRVGDAVRLIEHARSAEDYLRQAAARGGVLGKREGMEKQQLTPVGALALEMALHDEQERRAMQGELAALEAAWQQAEEIADIADRLPDVPARAAAHRLRPRLNRATYDVPQLHLLLGNLGSNDSIERFPVGRSLAFDGEKGRLWAVCGGARGGTWRRWRSAGRRSKAPSACSATRGCGCRARTSAWRSWRRDAAGPRGRGAARRAGGMALREAVPPAAARCWWGGAVAAVGVAAFLAGVAGAGFGAASVY